MSVTYFTFTGGLLTRLFKRPAVFPRGAHGFWAKNCVPPAVGMLPSAVSSSVSVSAGAAGGDGHLVARPRWPQLCTGAPVQDGDIWKNPRHCLHCEWETEYAPRPPAARP